MGRIKTQLTKRVAKKLLVLHPEKFKTTFEDNKKLVEETADIKSDKLRNIIAGYVTRLVRARK